MCVGLVKQMVTFPKITTHLNHHLISITNFHNALAHFHRPLLHHNLASLDSNNLVSLLNLGMFLTIIQDTYDSQNIIPDMFVRFSVDFNIFLFFDFVDCSL